MADTAYRTIEVKPVSGAIGAEIHGVDLSKSLGNEQMDEIHRAFRDHLVIFFRDQTLDPDQYLAFARRFGEPVQYPFSDGIPGHPEIVEILKEPHETQNFGGSWHADSTYTKAPPLGTMLYALETPPYGGDTLFANMYMAYDALSDGMKRMLSSMKVYASASIDGSGGRKGRDKNGSAMKLRDLDKAESFEAVHPAVRTHPVTGRKSLFLNTAHTVRFEGWTEEESRPLMRFLFDHLSRPEFTCRFRWAPGSLTLWDNRCAQHYALNDYHGHRRRMHRITLGGEIPV